MSVCTILHNGVGRWTRWALHFFPNVNRRKFHSAHREFCVTCGHPTACYACCAANNERQRQSRTLESTSSSESSVVQEKWQKYSKAAEQANKLVVRDIGYLCQPLWSFPLLGSLAGAQQFFRAQSSKWDAKQCQWLVHSQWDAKHWQSTSSSS